jgi:segregation and condensation protein B
MKGKKAQMSEEVQDIYTELLNIDYLQAGIEAILFVADEPLSAVDIATHLDVPAPTVVQALEQLKREYEERESGIELRCIDEQWRMSTSLSIKLYVEKYVRAGQVARLTQASLETLAVIAYKQPVSRARISAIRGVNVDGVVKTLESRGLIEVSSTDPDTQANLYKTTHLFLDKLGLNSLAELPEISSFVPDLEQAVEIQEGL